MKLSIVIPNYNGANLLTKNIPRLFDVLKLFHEKTHETVEVIVVDDCSQDEIIFGVYIGIEKHQNFSHRMSCTFVHCR